MANRRFSKTHRNSTNSRSRKHTRTFILQNGCQRNHKLLQHGSWCIRHDWSAQASSSPQASIKRPRAHLMSDATDVPRARSTMIPMPASVASADVMASTRTREDHPPPLRCGVSFIRAMHAHTHSHTTTYLYDSTNTGGPLPPVPPRLYNQRPGRLRDIYHTSF
ncbi:hypothetical protein LZ30DRAFT_690892 [Colletotrichum cereale]|nr:hypothetical protein LZ30DRAFT_690892 [Colletotrichum cereale]